jgi:hypothetical protein
VNPYDDDQVLAYLAGERDGLPPAPPGLDDLRALLADPTTWEQPPPMLGDKIVAAIAVEASTAPRPAPAVEPEPAPAEPTTGVVVRGPARWRRFAPAGLTAAAVAASLAVGTVLGANLDDDSPGTAEVASGPVGQQQSVVVPPAGLPSVAVTAQEKEQFTPADFRELTDPAGSVGTGPSLGRFPGLLYWLATGPDGSARLTREVAQIYDKNGRATGSLRALLNRRPADPDARNPWPTGASGDVDLTSVAGGVGVPWPAGTAVVYLNSAALKPRNVSVGEARAAVQQIVWTLRANDPSITSVVLDALEKSDRKALRTNGLWNSGVKVSTPTRAADAASVLAPVQIDGPIEAASLDPTAFTVSGAAISPTGRLRWEVLDRGQVVQQGETTTTSCCSLSPYSFQLTLPPGRWTIVVYPGADASSGGTSRTVEVSGTAT